MKKFLMVTTAIAGASLMSAPASAAIDLNVGGFFSGYVVNTDVDGVNNTYDTEFRRDTELSFSGETVLDNGLTVGAHSELKVGVPTATADSVNTDEIYAYVSNAYGRVNFGDEDGAAFLLQVTAPSADANVDGADASISGRGEDTLTYAQIADRDTDRVTYLSPKYNGFQAAASYAPHFGLASNNSTNAAETNAPAVLAAATEFDTAASTVYKNPYELAVRYDGEFQGFGVNVGAGYAESDLEAKGTVAQDTYTQTDGITQYNVGANVAYQGFTVGGSYGIEKTTFTGDSTAAAGVVATTADLTGTTYVIGGAYDMGAYHVGVSYLDKETEFDAFSATRTGAKIDTDRYTVGGGYAFGPGMTFRGAVAWGSEDVSSAATGAFVGYNNVNTSTDYQQITVGTDIQF
jgi:hypothetical protein